MIKISILILNTLIPLSLFASTPNLKIKIFDKEFIHLKDYQDCGFDRKYFPKQFCFDEQCIQDLDLKVEDNKVFLKTSERKLLLGNLIIEKKELKKIFKCSVIWPHTSSEVVTNQVTTYKLILEDDLKLTKYKHEVNNKLRFHVNDLGETMLKKKWISSIDALFRTEDSKIRIEAEAHLYSDESHDPFIPRLHLLKKITDE